jgi:two-component system NarL family response regulator
MNFPTALIRLLIVDDHHVVRSGITASVQLEDDIRVVAEAENPSQAIALAKEHRPDVILMDLRMPDGGGIPAAAALRTEAPDSRVLIFTTFDGDEDVYRAMQAGAYGYLLKSAPRDELLIAIRTVAAKKRYLPPALGARLASRLSAQNLSAREVEVLRFLGRGRANKQIGAELGISEETVKRHVSNIFAKMGVADRAQATAEALKRGIIHFD